MAKQTINIGSGELTGDGESLRSAFDKINDNFDEVYAGGIGTTLDSDTSPALGGNLDLSGNDITGIGNLNITGNITATGTINASLDYSNLTNTPTTIAGYGITDAFDGAFGSLTGTPTTIAGYGIADAYTKTEVDNAITSSVLPSGSTQSIDIVAQDSTLLVDSVNGTVNISNQNLDALADISYDPINDNGPPSFSFQPLIWDSVAGKWMPGYAVTANTLTANTRIQLNGNGSEIEWVDDTSNGGVQPYFTTRVRFNGTITQDHTITFPDATGTVALTNQLYTDLDVDAHLNQSNPTAGYVLSWDGADYAWVAQSGGGAETDPIVGAITGIVKADGAGNISAAVAGTDYLTSVAYSDLTSTPTTIAGYGITDAFDGAFGSLSGTPTTLAGYGITDALTAGSALEGSSLQPTDETTASTQGTTLELSGGDSTGLNSDGGDLTLVGGSGSSGTHGDISIGATQTGSITIGGAAGTTVGGTLAVSNTATFNGNAIFDTGVQEKFATLTGSTGVTAMDCDNGQVFYLTGAAGDITANFTNLGLTAEYGTNVTVIINQGATPYEVTAVQIGGAAQTINWQGGTPPTGNANGIDSFSFTILNDGGTYVVLGQMVDFT